MQQNHFTGDSPAPGKLVSLGHGIAAEIASHVKRTQDYPSLKIKAGMIFGLFWLLPEFSVSQACVLNKAEVSDRLTELSVLPANGIPLKKINFHA